MKDLVESYTRSGICLMFSVNPSLQRLIRKAIDRQLRVVVYGSNILDRRLLQQTAPKVIVFDDGLVDPSERLWMLKQIRRFAPDANVLYLATEHTPEFERRVRATGVAYYGPSDQARVYAIVRKLCSNTVNVQTGNLTPLRYP
jgi:DNA-binding NarL/FixJ family response regulator